MKDALCDVSKIVHMRSSYGSPVEKFKIIVESRFKVRGLDKFGPYLGRSGGWGGGISKRNAH